MGFAQGAEAAGGQKHASRHAAQGAVEPEEGFYDPAAQVVHDAAPDNGPYVPGAQGAHADAFAPPAAGLAEPAGQSEHCAAPAPSV
jgi:hypothetical protein